MDDLDLAQDRAAGDRRARPSGSRIRSSGPNYPDALTKINFPLALRNTPDLCRALGDRDGRSRAALVAYGFARVRWPGRDIVFVILLATMMLPTQVTFIPLYVIYAKLGWVGTFLPLIVPTFLGHPFFIFLLRQFFLGIPTELSDAARIDGASELRILWPDHPAAVVAGAHHRGAVHVHRQVGRLLRAADLPAATRSSIRCRSRSRASSPAHKTDWPLSMAAAAVDRRAARRASTSSPSGKFIEGITFTGIKG